MGGGGWGGTNTAKVDGGDVLEEGLGVLEEHGPLLLKGLRKVDPAPWLEEGQHVAQRLLRVRHQHEAPAEVRRVESRLGEVINRLVNNLKDENRDDSMMKRGREERGKRGTDWRRII